MEIIVDRERLFSCDIAGSLKRWNWRVAKEAFAEDAESPQLQATATKQKAHESDIDVIALNAATNKLFSCGKDNCIKF